MIGDSLAASGGQLPLGIELSLETRLDDFLAGPNHEALAAARALADGRLSGCLYLAGPRASGKSHLLQGMARAAQSLDRRVVYLPLARPEMREPELLAGWEGFDLVCIDDLDAVAGAGEWEAALFRLFEGLREHGGRLACAGATVPAGMDFALRDLASRLGSGPVYRLAALDDHDLLEALRRRLDRRGLDLPEESARWLMRRVRRDMHSLTRLADQLDRLSLSAKRRLTVPFLREVLGSAGASPVLEPESVAGGEKEQQGKQ